MKSVRRIMAMAGVAATMSLPRAMAQEGRPNVVYVFPDQLRNCALNFWSTPEYRRHAPGKADPTHTPNIDRFASESVVLSQAVSTCPVSSPYRGMLLTGMFPERNGVTLNCMAERPESTLSPEAECIGDIFAAAGYDCAYIGKLHADYPTPNDPQNPGNYVSDLRPEWDAYTPPERRHGFRYWYSYGTYDVHKHPHYWDTEGRRHDIDEWSPKHEIDKAVEFLTGGRDESKPFLLMIGMNPPHSPYSSTDDCMEEDYALYSGRSLGELLVRPNADTTMAKAVSAAYYFANVTGVDREFGRLLKALDEAGVGDNTIVVFTSDHGETMCSHSAPDPKNSIWRESFNVPFIVRYPGVLRHRVDDMLFSSTDIMPTLLGLAGLEQKIPASVEGRDLSPALRGERRAQRPASALYIRNLNGRKDSAGMVRGIFGEARGVKTRRHTMEITIDRKGAMKQAVIYDDMRDPYQLLPLTPQEHPKLFATLCRDLARELRRSNDLWYRERTLSEILPYDE